VARGPESSYRAADRPPAARPSRPADTLATSSKAVESVCLKDHVLHSEVALDRDLLPAALHAARRGSSPLLGGQQGAWAMRYGDRSILAIEVSAGLSSAAFARPLSGVRSYLQVPAMEHHPRRLLSSSSPGSELVVE
jgi:hypothetical protein